MPVSKPYAVSIEGNEILVWKSLAKPRLLSHCRGVAANNVPLLRSADVNSLQKCREIVLLALDMRAYLHKGPSGGGSPMRFTSYQLDSIDQEWGLIQSQHGALARVLQENGSGQRIAHLSFPSGYAYFRTDPHAISEFMLKSIRHLQQQFNSEAWCVYCSWLNDESDKARRGFYPDASDEYQLQGYLEDLSHEVNSFILRDTLDEIHEATLQENEVAGKESREKLFSLQKRASAARGHLRPLLETQCEIIGHIVDGIAKIEVAHPSLLPLRTMAKLLHLLLLNHLTDPEKSWGWGKQLLHMHLLDDSLNVMPAISCDTGVERTNLVFSIRLAMAELKKSYSPDQMLAMCQAWDNPDAELQNMRDKLCTCVLSNLLALGITDRQELMEGHETHSWGPNLDVLSFLPPVFEERKGSGQIIQVLKVDAQTGMVCGCTAEGRDLLRRLAVL